MLFKRKEKYTLDMDRIPAHIAFIMDGNGRWAKKRKMPRTYGHHEGTKTIRNLALEANNLGVKAMTVYAFSTENFKRDKKEVDYLMNLFSNGLKSSINFFGDRNIKVIVSGRKDNLPKKVINTINTLETKTKDNTLGILNICLNYGGKAEIIDASKEITKDVIAGKISVDDINEELFKKYLYNNLIDVDLLIRTGGELRISNFMIYESAYAELYFTDTYFPDFDELEFDKALDSFNKRDRRFGGVNGNKNN